MKNINILLSKLVDVTLSGALNKKIGQLKTLNVQHSEAELALEASDTPETREAVERIAAEITPLEAEITGKLEALIAANEPQDPAPVDPAPVDPAPVDPAPVDPAPVDPAPVDPAPVDPAPQDPPRFDPPTPPAVDPEDKAKKKKTIATVFGIAAAIALGVLGVNYYNKNM